VKLLAADAMFYGDGGGKALSVAHPVRGGERVARLMHAIVSKYAKYGLQLRAASVNGQPGAMTFDRDGRLINVFALDIAEGAVQAIRSVINPDKLRHLGPLSDLALVRSPATSPSPKPQ
jgi:RNA polymerase sigma-70 factor, ECF subfamily